MKTKFKNGNFNTGKIDIYVTKNHVASRGSWSVSVARLNWKAKSIPVPDSATQEEAEEKAVEVVKNHLTEILESIDGINLNQILLTFFMWFRENGKKHMEKSIEKMIEIYINEHEL